MWRCHWFLGIRGVTWGPVGQPCSLWNAFKLRCTKLMVDYIRLKCVGPWAIVLRHLFDLVPLIISQCFFGISLNLIHSFPTTTATYCTCCSPEPISYCRFVCVALQHMQQSYTHVWPRLLDCQIPSVGAQRGQIAYWDVFGTPTQLLLICL